MKKLRQEWFNSQRQVAVDCSGMIPYTRSHLLQLLAWHNAENNEDFSSFLRKAVDKGYSILQKAEEGNEVALS